MPNQVCVHTDHLFELVNKKTAPKQAGQANAAPSDLESGAESLHDIIKQFYNSSDKPNEKQHFNSYFCHDCCVQQFQSVEKSLITAR